jgi:hypothetical protein
LILEGSGVCLKFNCEVVFYSGQVQEEAFYVCDIGDIVRKHKEWKLKMPRVEPHYGKTDFES